MKAKYHDFNDTHKILALMENFTQRHNFCNSVKIWSHIGHISDCQDNFTFKNATIWASVATDFDYQFYPRMIRTFDAAESDFIWLVDAEGI